MTRGTRLGIDPGRNGGMAVADADGGILETHKMPGTPADIITLLTDIASRHEGVRCIMERQQARHGDTSNTAFAVGRRYGWLESGLAAAGIPYKAVTPQMWQRNLCVGGASYAERKQRLKRIAQSMWPDQRVTLWNCDAMLIAVS